MHRKWFWSVVGIAMLTGTLQGQSRESILQAIAENSSWTPTGSPVEHDRSGIEAFVGGRAGIINTYGFAGVTIQQWTGPQGPVRLALYQMLDPSGAYGWFSLERDLDRPGIAPLPIGSEGFRLSNRSLFWQSNYVVELEGGARAAESLGRLVSANILGRSRRPPVSNWLPPNNLLPGTDKYILSPESLDRDLELDTSSLGFEDSVEIAVAGYNIGGQRAHLVLLLYPTQQVALKYAEQWDLAHPEDAAFRKRVSRLLALVRGSRDPDVAGTILDTVNYESQVTWNEPPGDISVRDLLVTAFTFIGLGFLFILVAGFGFGGVRLMVKAKYPGRIFDRPEDMEIIQLKLGQGLIRKELGE